MKSPAYRDIFTPLLRPIFFIAHPIMPDWPGDDSDEEGPEWDVDSSYDLEGMEGYGETEDDDDAE
jgi:hypothetical protein